MSSMVRLFTVFSLIIPTVRTNKAWELKCQPTVGVVGQTTVIRCEYIINADIKDMQVIAVSLKKSTQNEFVFVNYGNGKLSGDQRFSLENPANSPSLKITNTTFSDEDKYLYHVITNRGDQREQFSISVTAMYKDPKISTWPENVTDRGTVSLYCNATEGYPAGFIHWFDRSGTNWTINSDLRKVTNNANGLKSVALYSKLTFKSINFDLAPFRCVVLNSKYVQDGENAIKMLPSQISGAQAGASNTTQIVAGVMVIGSLIVGLLFALLFFRRRNFQQNRRPSTSPFLSHESTGNTFEDDPETGISLKS